MLGGLFAGTETPGETVLFRAVPARSYRGMGSLGAMRQGAADRYFQDNDASTSWCRKASKVACPTRGPVVAVIHQLMGACAPRWATWAARPSTTPGPAPVRRDHLGGHPRSRTSTDVTIPGSAELPLVDVRRATFFPEAAARLPSMRFWRGRRRIISGPLFTTGYPPFMPDTGRNPFRPRRGRRGASQLQPACSVRGRRAAHPRRWRVKPAGGMHRQRLGFRSKSRCSACCGRSWICSSDSRCASGGIFALDEGWPGSATRRLRQPCSSRFETLPALTAVESDVPLSEGKPVAATRQEARGGSSRPGRTGSGRAPGTIRARQLSGTGGHGRRRSPRATPPSGAWCSRPADRQSVTWLATSGGGRGTDRSINARSDDMVLVTDARRWRPLNRTTLLRLASRLLVGTKI